MKILITGATGLIGRELTKQLLKKELYSISVLTRNTEAAKKTLPYPIDFYEWNIEKDLIDPKALNDVDIIINLVGENIASKRWSESQKEKLINSRTKPIDLILQNIATTKKPIQFISASAIGIYGDRQEESLDETSELGHDFLANVCKQWENGLKDSPLNIKTNILRIGLVISSKGGALTKMLPIFRTGLAGPLGNGKQYMSWIHLDDLVNQIIFLIETKPDELIFNAVSPRPVSNYIFTAILAKELKRPAIIPAPKFILSMILGEMSNLLLTGQKVLPKVFLKKGFNYKFRSIKDALRAEIKNSQ